ncbi:MAG: c-type cytochrome [Candidatus Omnitrophica bacterium]|nr:c-type cytochrome [Candidatus Omnitrophota bacterium]
MAKPSPSLYSISKTFVWFALVSLLLLGSLIAIVLLDHHRDWKNWQKKFIALKLEKTEKELKAADEKLDKKKIQDLRLEIARTESDLKAHQSERAARRKAAAALEPRLARAKARAQDLKQFQDSYKYFFEEYRVLGDRRAADFEKKLAEIAPRLTEAKADLEDLEKESEAKKAALEAFAQKEKDLQKALDQILQEKTRVEKKIANVKPSLAKDILNAPMLDFLHPSLQIQQIALDGLEDDYHFAKTQKVDRCTTCHLAIDQKGFEDAPQPFRTHPKMDLYLGAASPHPVEKFGCTVCHSGNGHSVSFITASHTPHDEAQAKEWVKKYHWREIEKWDAKMLPIQHVQAACAKCHRSVVEVPQADKLNRGRRLAARYGCFNCHKISGFEDRWKAGPDLRRVGSKVDREWVIRWLQNPRDFRSSTRMPQIFHLSNTQSPDEKNRDDAAIEAIAVYLMKNSETVELSVPPAIGNAEKGETFVKQLGCLGCHSLPGIKGGDAAAELSGLGSKVKPEWLYAWLKNPRHYSPNTRMPNLRLSDEEAADITAYLLSNCNDPFEKSAAPKARPEAVDQMLLDSMQGTMRHADAQKMLAGMTDEEKLEALGKKSIAHQGCFACHAIKGFEDQKPIGAELSNESRKDIHQFDFGFVDIEHSRRAFIAQKLRDPRGYDKGKVKAYYEKLRMPQFHLSDEEIESLTTFVLSLTDESMPLEMQKRPDLREAGVEKGRLLVSKLNCNACHALDGKTGALRALTEDPGAAPPILDGEGAKVREKWLHEFLKNPTPIRPWLTYRMPTFGLSDEETKTLVEYFAYLAHENISYKGAEVPETSPEKIEAGKKLFGQLQCAKCHEVNADSAAMGASFLAPDLTLAKKRLKPEWVKKWIEDPQTLQEGTMMPTFFADGQTPITDVLGGDAKEQIEAIRDYLYRYEAPDKTKGETREAKIPIANQAA